MRRLLRAAVLAFALLGFVVAVATFTPLVSWWGRALAGPWDDPKGDVLIVPAAAVVDSEMLAGSSYWRCFYATRAWREGGFRQIVVSGRTAAPLMRDFLVFHGVPAAAILVEDESGSTRENALSAKKLLAGVAGSKVLLTSDYHMYRAHRAFRKAGVNVTPRPFPDAIKRGSSLLARWDAFLTLCGEMGKIAYYYLRGWI